MSTEVGRVVTGCPTATQEGGHRCAFDHTCNVFVVIYREGSLCIADLEEIHDEFAHGVLGSIAGAVGDEGSLAVHEQPALPHSLAQRQLRLVCQLC